MIQIGLDPVAFVLGPFEVRWYGIMVVLAILSIIAITLLEAKRAGISQDHVYNFALWGIIGGILVSRLVHVIDKWDYYMAHPAQIIGFAGLGVYGAVIGALLGVLSYAWLKKLSLWQMGDLVAPGAILGQAVGRVGCLLNGCCYGLPTTLPWGIVYTHPGSYAVTNTPVHPTQVYHIIWNLAGFAILWSVRKRLKPRGSLMLLWLSWYAAGDLAIRFFRAGEPFLFGLQQAQLLGILILLVAAPLLVFRMVRVRQLGQNQAG